MPRLLPAVLLFAALAACSRAPNTKDLPADINLSLQPAFLTAFGHEAPAERQIVRAGKAVDLVFSPAAIARLSDDEAALASLAAPTDDACSGCAWSVAVHYLKARDNRFALEKGFFDIAPQGPLDEPPRLRVRNDLFEHPALEAESPRRDRGCEMSFVTLWELTSSGPVMRARDIPTERNNIPMGALRAGPQVDLYGNVIADRKGRRFRVHYHGSTEGDVAWSAGADGVYAPTAGGVVLPGC